MTSRGECGRPLRDLEHGNLPDLLARAVDSVLREQDRREELVTVLDSASGVASTKDERLDKIMIETPLSQGGGI